MVSAKATKFGIYRDRLDEALKLAQTSGLQVDGLHCHAGCGFLQKQLPAYCQTLACLVEMCHMIPDLKEINLGGGFGVPLKEGDLPLDMMQWAEAVKENFRDFGARLVIEPGDYIVKNAGVLLAEVTQNEVKAGIRFVGLNAGFNLHPEPAFYQLPMEPVPLQRSHGPLQKVTVVGNINEALDIWAQNLMLSEMKEGDGIALLNAGAYGSSMSSDHCLRKEVSEHLLPPNPSLEELDASNREAWDKLYASTPDLVWGRETVAFLKEFGPSLRGWISPGLTILDAGSGEGRNLPFLLSFQPSLLIALDSSESGLTKIAESLKEKVKPHLAPLDETGLEQDTIDFILMVDVAETLPDLNSVMAELFRILKPGGLLLCNFAAEEDGVAGIEMSPTTSSGFLYKEHYFFRFFEAAEARAICENQGFLVRESRKCWWEEPVHPGFRQAQHEHQSHVLLLEKPLRKK